MNHPNPSPARQRSMLRTFAYASGSVIFLLVMTTALSARTITLTAEDCDEMAAISPRAPRLSWIVGWAPIIYNPQPTLYWESRIALLMRFPIKDHIPNGQRITKTELTIASSYVAGMPEIHIRRILTDWGTGVCHQYRMTHPQKLEWAQAGGRGNSTDRANKDTAVLRFAKVGEQTVDLTEDLELWYTGAVANRGWIFTHESEGHLAYVPSPYSPHHGGAKEWKLQITFEPK